jgi:hypothetical protein
MKPRPPQHIARRQFLSETTLAVGATLSAAALARAKAAVSTPAHTYDIERFRKVDPALIRYERVRRFTVPKPEPRRLAIGADGLLRVAAGNSVLVLDASGSPRHEIELGSAARAVAVAPDGTLFVGVKDHVEIFDAARKRIATWDAPKGRPLLTGIAVADKDVFVADAGNRVVWRHDRSGKFLRRIGEKDEHRNIAGIVVPSPFFDVEVARDGLLRVANPGRHRVETYTFDGDLELSWGKPGAAIDAFCGCCNPCNIELLPDGRVVTYEKGLPRVKVFSAKGELEGVVAGPASFADPSKSGAALDDDSHGGLDGAIDALGNVFVLDLIARDVQVFAPKPARAA